MANQLKNRAASDSRKEDRAHDIYRRAAVVMCEKGYAATSMNDIAEAVGLTKAGIYHYISGKEELLFEIMSFAMDILDRDVIAPARAAAGPEERLRICVERHSRKILEAGGAITMVLEDTLELKPAHRRTIRARKRAYFEFVRDALRELAREGKLRGVDPGVAAFSLFGMINWLSRWYRLGGRMAPDETIRDLLEIAFKGLLRCAGERAPGGAL